LLIVRDHASGEGVPMTEREEIRQPDTVSELVAKYLDMTAPRTRAPRRGPPKRTDRERSTRPPFDNRGLRLEEGNDFA
jgi:hypothetical protein